MFFRVDSVVIGHMTRIGRSLRLAAIDAIPAIWSVATHLCNCPVLLRQLALVWFGKKSAVVWAWPIFLTWRNENFLQQLPFLNEIISDIASSSNKIFTK